MTFYWRRKKFPTLRIPTIFESNERMLWRNPSRAKVPLISTTFKFTWKGDEKGAIGSGEIPQYQQPSNLIGWCRERGSHRKFLLYRRSTNRKGWGYKGTCQRAGNPLISTTYKSAQKRVPRKIIRGSMNFDSREQNLLWRRS